MPRKPQLWRHMFPADVAPFASYILSDEGQRWTQFEFDIVVGAPNDPGPFFPIERRQQAFYLGALKIDCVAWFGEFPTIIECKPDADCGAIGQLYVYQWWYQQLFQVKPALLVVCNFLPEQIKIYCQAHNIGVAVYPDADQTTIDIACRYTASKIAYKSVLPQVAGIYS